MNHNGGFVKNVSSIFCPHAYQSIPACVLQSYNPYQFFFLTYDQDVVVSAPAESATFFHGE